MKPATADVDRKPYLDGLRGVAACVVLFGHLLIALAPPVIAVTGGKDHPLAPLAIAIGKTPLGIFWNGNSAVCVFFILSGYVMSELAQRSELGFVAQAVRRYVRLALPILLTSIFAYLLLKFGLYRNEAAGEIVHSGWLGGWYRFEPSFTDMLTESLYGTFAHGANSYNSNLWTMNPELFGSLYILLFNALTSSRRERAVFHIAFMIWFMTSYLALFAAGALLHDFGDRLQQALKRIGLALLPVLLFIVGCYICSMPDARPDNPLPWHFMLGQISDTDNARYWHSIGAFLIITGLLNSPQLQRMFGSSIGRFLGRISFVLYLIHIPIICSLTAAIVVATEGTSSLIMLLLSAPITVVAVVALSAATSPIVDGGAIRLSRAAGRAVTQILNPLQSRAGRPEATR